MPTDRLVSNLIRPNSPTARRQCRLRALESLAIQSRVSTHRMFSPTAQPFLSLPLVALHSIWHPSDIYAPSRPLPTDFLPISSTEIRATNCCLPPPASPVSAYNFGSLIHSSPSPHIAHIVTYVRWRCYCQCCRCRCRDPRLDASRRSLPSHSKLPTVTDSCNSPELLLPGTCRVCPPCPS